MNSRRKALVASHVLGSTLSLGVTVVMLALLLFAMSSDDEALLRVDDLLLRVVAIPALVVALATGVLVALTSPWGLLRHTWVVKKLGLLLVTLGFALFLLMPWLAAGERWLVLAGLVLQLVKLTLITVLSIYKPKGRFGKVPERAPVAVGRG
ncbi:hypothetical protein ALI144C_08190 [Actinosynnema sp. ALI-1.44]|uniref:hypothetical protein n=1 Tax=Actinosynnema sp. ALI-1.44 TaxID=1933779 RepID=UPI00097BE623|nr:hypothetical protein [Actinosynnema sp. ALI-1.44]ONI87905.1 hypothetical protein ALI144C_08190 [Actinosynnema sp. ALI-1.44]